MKLRLLFFVGIIAVSLLTGRYVGGLTVNAQIVDEPPPGDGTITDIGDSPEACLAEALTEYMNTVIDGAGSLPNIRLLSPAFNLTSPVEPVVFSYMNLLGANFGGLYGYAGNTYTVGGKSAMGHYRDNGWAAAFGSRPVIFTEYGDFLTDSVGSGHPARSGLISSMQASFNEAAGSGIDAINYFSALDTITSNPEFINRHRLSESELRQIVSGSPSLGGINQGVGISNGVQENKAAELGMGWAVELITGGGEQTIQSVLASANAQSSVQIVVRLCYGSSCGFSDPEVLIDFLTTLNGRLSRPVYVIAGPNEPASEPWVAPECAAIPGVVQVGAVPGLPPNRGNPPPAPEPPIPYTPCDETQGEEFHSLRPYPASPCDYPAVYTETKMCAEKLTAREVFQVMPEDANQGCVQTSPTTQTCNYAFTSNVNFSVFTGLTRLPIVGNTELVPNSQNDGENELDSPERMNEYASWYLNGVTGRAEEEDEFLSRGNLVLTPQEEQERIHEVINYSGPLKKLLPWEVQNWFTNWIAGAQFPIDDPSEGPISIRQQERIRTPQRDPSPPQDRHNQIVVCTPTALSRFPVPCYSSADGNRYRLTDIVPASDFGPLANFIPFSTTEDIRGMVELEFEEYGGTITFAGTPSTELPTQSMLSFPHMLEVNELANILQKTFTSSEFVAYDTGYTDDEGPTANSPGRVLYGNPPLDQYEDQLESEDCSIQRTVRNPGDLLYGGWDIENGQFVNENPPAYSDSNGSITYSGSFSCDFVSPPADATCILSCEEQITAGVLPLGTDCAGDICVLPPPPCMQYADFEFRVESSTPLAESLWDKLVAGSYGVFRRMFPRVEDGAPVDEIEDIPAEDEIWYTANNTGVDIPLAGTAPIAGDPDDLKQGSQANIYFPHIGSVHEYFLNGIQCALRPRGLCGNEEFSGDELPTGTPGVCSIQGSGIASQELLNIIAGAARWANIPVELLITVVRGEGCGGGDRTGGICLYSDSEVLQFSAPGAVDPRNCPASGSKGPLQMYEDSVNWDPWRDAVNMATGEGRVPEICNLKDAIYAGAYRLSAGYDSCPNPGHNVGSVPLSSWDIGQIRDTLTAWGQGCSVPQCSGVAGAFYCANYDLWSGQITTDCN